MKKKYYVSVETGQILEEKGASGYEFEIEATHQDLQKLQRLFSKKDTENIELFVDPHVPHRWDEVEEGVQVYNDYLMNVYAMLYKLGTPETKEHIEENNLIGKLKEGWQDYDFS